MLAGGALEVKIWFIFCSTLVSVTNIKCQKLTDTELFYQLEQATISAVLHMGKYEQKHLFKI